MKSVYITSLGVALPNSPIKNDEIESYLGKINGKESRLRERILKSNGILKRYYALDNNQNTTHSNADLAAEAIANAIRNSNVRSSGVQLLCAATTQADLLVPGFASQVHPKTTIPTCELASFQSVCSAGIMGLKDAYSKIKAGEHATAVSVASEMVSRSFKAPIQELMQKGGGSIAPEKWFSNLSYKGNTGSASIYIMLEELFYSGKLQAGQTILCMVPESGRFITSFMKLTVVGPENHEKKQYAIREINAPELQVNQTETTEWLVRNLSEVWIDFESALLKVPIVEKIHGGNISLEDYKLLLHDLRQQVIDGSQWIARAASNIDISLFELRSAFIKHTATEHKDYQMLEKNFANLGEPIENIQTGQKNIGSLALSSFMFQQASKPNPVDLMGAMFIIEGIGKRLAAFWGEMIQNQLHLNDDQVSFFIYHGVADENHFHRLEEAINHPMMNMEIARQIVKTAKTVARLYQLQLSELGNY